MKQTPMVIEVCFIFSVSLLDVILHSLRQLLQCLAKYASLRSNIQSHESLAARSEHLTIIQCQESLVDEEVKELVVVKMQVTAVEHTKKEACGRRGRTPGICSRQKFSTNLMFSSM